MAQWELLVTEGHVRAARWRAAAGPVALIAIVLILSGLWFMSVMPQQSPALRAETSKNQVAAEARRAAAVFVADKGALPSTPVLDAEHAVSPKAARQDIQAIGQALYSSGGKLPDNVARVTPEAFWSGAWKPGEIIAVAGKKAVLIGFYVDEMGDYEDPQRPLTGYPPRLARVFGVFHRVGSAWRFYCLRVPRAGSCGTGQSVDAASIPATLRELVPAGAFERQKKPGNP